MMNDIDRNLVTDLAEGLLSGSAAEEATARINSNPELVASYLEQLAVIEHLRSLSPPQMSTKERSALHSNLTKELGFQHNLEPTSKTKRSLWLRPVMGLAAACIFVAAIVVIPSSLTTSSDGTLEVAFVEKQENSDTFSTTTASPAMAGAPPIVEIQPESQPESMPDTPIEEVAASDPGLRSSNILESLLYLTVGATSQDEVNILLAELNPLDLSSLSESSFTECIMEREPDLPNGVQGVLLLGYEELDDLTVAYLGIDLGAGIEKGVALNLSTCEIIDYSY